jgi:UDP-N-acetylmuramoyl-L-alanyl-D-glutamate--2,6-diaminopimelate ligase
MNLRNLIEGLRIESRKGDLEKEVSAIAIDSREAVPGSLFAALPGQRRDGRSFIDDAVRRGAGTVVLEGSLPGEPREGVVYLAVADVRKALALLSANFFGRPAERMHLIGITGTNGKTTLAYLIRSILETSGEKTGLLGTVKYYIGEEEHPAPYTTPDPVHLHGMLRKMADAGCRFAVMEVSSHALALDRVAGCRFDAAVFTNLTQDHLDFHGEMEAYFRTKARLFHPPYLHGRAVIQGDDPFGRRLIGEVTAPLWSYGLDGSWDIRAEGLSVTLEGIRFNAETPGGKFPVHSRLVGRYNAVNILGAIGACLSLGIAPEEIARGIRSMERVPGRMEKIDEGQGFTVIVDYAHTEDALTRVLQTLQTDSGRRIITVFGCGGERDRGKRPRMGRAAALLSDLVIATSDNPRGEDPKTILSESEAGIRGAQKENPGGRRGEYRIIEDRREAIREAVRRASSGDVVVIAGKGHEAHQVIGDRRIPLDDREIAREALQERIAAGAA